MKCDVCGSDMIDTAYFDICPICDANDEDRYWYDEDENLCAMCGVNPTSEDSAYCDDC